MILTLILFIIISILVIMFVIYFVWSFKPINVSGDGKSPLFDNAIDISSSDYNINAGRVTSPNLSPNTTG